MNNVFTEIGSRSSDFLLLERFRIVCVIFGSFWQISSNTLPLCALKMNLSIEQSFFFSMMWVCVGVLLLWVGSRGHADSQLVQFSPAEFYHKLDTGKIMLVFFQRQGVLLVSAKECPGKISLQLTFCLYQQATILTDKILFPLWTSVSNCLSVLGGARKVCRGSARLWNTSWEGNHPWLSLYLPQVWCLTSNTSSAKQGK